MGKEIIVVQLSDIHFNAKNNSVQEKSEKLYDAIKNEIGRSKNIFIIITGDIANTGAKSEYDIAYHFLNNLEHKLKEYCQHSLEIHFIFAPGNHDCDFSTDEDIQEIREVMIEKVLTSPNDIKPSWIKQCVTVQENYFNFIANFNSYNNINHDLSNNLFKRYEYEIEDKKIAFNSFNIAWLSKQKETQAQLIYPINNIDMDSLESLDIHYSISLFHHPFHWLDHISARSFKDFVNKTSDLLFTGHEHTSSGSKIEGIDNSYMIQHIEAASLQEKNPKKSSFNLFKIDLENDLQEFCKYEWEEDFYEKKISNNGNIVKKTKTLFSMKKSYMEYINKLAIKINHPYQEDIGLSDIFIYPDLKAISMDKENENSMFIEKSSDTLKEISSLKKSIVYGNETSGKSSLLRMLQMHYYRNDYVAIIIDSTYIDPNDHKENNLKSLITKSFKKEYERSAHTLSKFEQLDKNKIVLLIDGFEKAKLNSEYKGKFIQTIEDLGYSNILITSHEHLRFEATTEGILADVLKHWDHYSIKELGHKLRSKFIRQWIILGQESSLEKTTLTLQVREKAESINKTVGYNIIPAYPVYIMALLQAMEANETNNLAKSSYGHYYQYLILDNLKKAKENLEPKDINTIFGFTSQYAFEIFKTKNYLFTLEDIKNFLMNYCVEKEFTPLFDIVDTLIASSIIVQYEGKYKFTHNFIYYYFVANYFAEHYTKAGVEEIIFKMSERLYRTEFANILMFILHLTPKDAIIARLIEESKKIFSEMQEFTFSTDEVKSLNNSIKRDFIECNEKSLEENHHDKLESDQKKEHIEKNINKEDRDEADYNENIQELNLFAKINLSFKMIEILGEIIKNYSGTLDGGVKHDMISETHSVGLRTLKSLMDLFENEHQNIMKEIKKMVEKKHHVTSDKINDDIARLVYGLASNVSTNVIKKIAKATASKDLRGLLKKIIDKDPENNAKLILEQAIELDFENGMNIKELINLHNKFKDEKNNICNTTLKKLVLEHLYMFNISFDKKQSICQKLDINTNESKSKMISMKK